MKVLPWQEKNAQRENNWTFLLPNTAGSPVAFSLLL